jgi:hypothetical protein
VDLLFLEAFTCLERADVIPWIEYSREVLSLAFTFHRYHIIAGINRLIEEPYRPVFSTEILSLRKGIELEFYIGRECVEKIDNIVVIAEGLMNMLMARQVINRTTVGLARLVAFLQRSLGAETSIMSPRALMRILNELYTHVMTAVELLTPSEESTQTM